MKFAYKSNDRPLDGYTIKRGVGSGGFGEVYLARSDGGKDVALKRIQRNLDIEVRGVKQCMNLKHPNLVALFDLKYDDEGQAWVVMEYVSGPECSLKDVVEKNPSGMRRPDADRWFREIAAGVGCLHDHGIVHRDLKPANIFDDEGVVKIGDYGLSKFISASRRSGQTESVGTFHYMAPEIGKGVYGKEIDIYALGIILFEMLTGRVPFDGETSQEIIMKHLTDNPDLSGVPEPYRSVIQKALRKDPEKRFRSVQQMLDQLNGKSKAEEEPVLILDSREEKLPEPIYIGDEAESDSEMVFGPVRHSPVVSAQTVPPVRGAAPRPVRASVPRGYHTQPQVVAQNAGSWAPFMNLVVMLGLIGLVAIAPQTLPLVAVIAIGYLGYVLCRLLFCRRGATCQNSGQRRCNPEDPVWRAEMRRALKSKLPSERIAELTGTLLFSAITVAVLTFVALLLQGETLDGSVAGWSVFAWLTMTGVAGSWLLLTLGKFWEGDDGEHFLRRFVMLVAGLMIGGIAFGAANMLMVPLPDLDTWTAHAFSHEQMVGSVYAADGSPLIPAYLVYFAGLFAILRWWTQTDPLRRARLSLTATALCVLWAWIMHMFCAFPQPWGFMLAATISVATQLSAPWVNPRRVSNEHLSGT